MKTRNYRSYFVSVVAATLVSLSAAQAFALTVCNIGGQANAINNATSTCVCGSTSINNQTRGTVKSQWQGFGNGFSNAKFTLNVSVQAVAPAEVWTQTWEDNTWAYHPSGLRVSSPFTAATPRTYSYKSNTWAGAFRAVCAN